jgi:uncharacterized protein (UPF0248 family)
MEEGKSIRIFYIDGTTPDGRDHVSNKNGTIIKEVSGWVYLIVEGKEIAIPRDRIIRIEFMESENDG